jgi:hypothetical protein
MHSTRFSFVNHETSITALSELMSQAAVSLDPESFITLVSQVFQTVQAAHAAADMSARFRADPGYRTFRKAMQFAQQRLRLPISALVIGCGAGYAGCGPAYAVSVLQEIFPPGAVRELKEMATSPIYPNEAQGGPYDVVVSHSMWHFVPGLARFAVGFADLVKPGGYYIMGHEPNARFVANADCQDCRAAARKSIRLRGKLIAVLRRSLEYRRTAQRPMTLHEQINRVLRMRYNFKTDLTAGEISRLVDPHFPVESSTMFRIGCDGFDWTHLGADLLTCFELAWVGTSGHLGVLDRARLSRRWIREEARLAQQYPHDGSSFSAVWIRT